jgi:hypothetical protein
MTKEFVPYELALKLKQLGFDEPCFARFNNDGDLLIAHTEKYIIDNGVDRSEFFTLAPLFQQVFRWFIENYDLHYEIRYRPSIRKNLRYTTKYIDISPKYIYQVESSLIEVVSTYEEAELACLDKLIEILETKQQEQ